MDDLIRTISNDLKIERYDTESEESYKCRIIYSALAIWIKCQTVSIDGKDVSQKFITQKCTNILQHYLSRYNDCEKWFMKNKEGKNLSPISILEQRLFSCGEIIRKGFQQNVSLPYYQSEFITYNLVRIKGLLQEGLLSNQFVSGCVILQENNNSLYFLEKDNISKEELIMKIFYQTNWTSKELHYQNIEYFNPMKKKTSLYQRWQREPLDQIHQNLPFICFRVKNEILYSYYLIRVKDGNSTKIPEFYIKTGKVKRLLFILSAMVGNPIRYRKQTYNKLIIVKLNAVLPETENDFLCACGWPIRSIDDNRWFVFHGSVWPVIKHYFDHLGMIEEGIKIE